MKLAFSILGKVLRKTAGNLSGAVVAEAKSLPVAQAVALPPACLSVGDAPARATFSGTMRLQNDMLLSMLRAYGVARVYGIFDETAWNGTCRAAGLYRLPLGGAVPCCTGKLMADADKDAENADDWYWSNGKPVITMLYRNMAAMKHEDLVRTLFPNGEAVRGGDTSIAVEFPQPPKRLWPSLHAAGLAGLCLYVAVPDSAITLPKVAAWARAAVDRSKRDPIVYGVEPATQRVVVLGYYNISWHDPDALKALIGVLERGKIELR